MNAPVLMRDGQPLVKGVDYFDIVALADLHCGDKQAPQPEHFQSLSGETLEPNEIRRGLNKALAEITSKWQQPNALVLLGDMVQGQHSKITKNGTGVWSPQIIDQVKAVARLINAFNAERIYVIRGTDGHVNIEGLPVEEYLAANILPKEKVRAIGTGNYVSAIKIILNKWGIRLHFAHHSQTSQSDWFLATPIQKEGIRLRLKMKEIGDVQGIFRGHNHYYAKVEFGSQILVQVPCWQLPGEWFHRKSGEPIFDIGAIRVRIFKEPDDMEKRMRIQKKLFKIPEGVTREIILDAPEQDLSLAMTQETADCLAEEIRTSREVQA